MTITTMRTGGLALVCTALLTLGLAAGYAGAADPPAAAPTPWAGDPYLLATDPVSGAALPDKPIVYLHEDRELRFADAKSLEEFKAHPAQYLPAVDQKMIAQQAPWYPLGVCVISGEKIGDH